MAVDGTVIDWPQAPLIVNRGATEFVTRPAALSLREGVHQQSEIQQLDAAVTCLLAILKLRDSKKRCRQLGKIRIEKPLPRAVNQSKG